MARGDLRIELETPYGSRSFAAATTSLPISLSVSGPFDWLQWSAFDSDVSPARLPVTGSSSFVAPLVPGRNVVSIAGGSRSTYLGFDLFITCSTASSIRVTEFSPMLKKGDRFVYSLHSWSDPGGPGSTVDIAVADVDSAGVATLKGGRTPIDGDGPYVALDGVRLGGDLQTVQLFSFCSSKHMRLSRSLPLIEPVGFETDQTDCYRLLSLGQIRGAIVVDNLGPFRGSGPSSVQLSISYTEPSLVPTAATRAVRGKFTLAAGVGVVQAVTDAEGGRVSVWLKEAKVGSLEYREPLAKGDAAGAATAEACGP